MPRGRLKRQLLVSPEDGEHGVRWRRRSTTSERVGVAGGPRSALCRGVSNRDVTAQPQVSEARVGRWRQRYISPTSGERGQGGEVAAALHQSGAGGSRGRALVRGAPLQIDVAPAESQDLAPTHP